MRIGIDARFYGLKQKGLGRYAQKLIEELEKINSNDSFVVFLRKENWNEYQAGNVRFEKRLANYRWYTLSEQFFMPFVIKRARVDVMYFPHFNVPIFCPCPFVMTIHDLILKRFPTRKASMLGPIKYFLKNAAYQFVVNEALRRAKKVIAVSERTRKDVLKYFHVSKKKIDVVYEGAPLPSEKKDISVLERYGIKKPYILYIGNAYPHKNLDFLVSVFNRMNGNLNLVLVGSFDYFYNRLRRKSDGNSRIIFTGFVSDEDLTGVYQNALLYIFPSLCEGFGLPPLEAMACGLPVLSSSASCLPEILGRSALYFDPHSAYDMEEKIKMLASNEKLREDFARRGFERIKKYSWRKMAQSILSILENA